MLGSQSGIPGRTENQKERIVSKRRYDYQEMLKIERAKWHGTCSRHPMFDPEADGIGAIKGGCPRCLELLAIFESHRNTLRLMRAFAPTQTTRTGPSVPGPDQQQDLFASLPSPENRKA